MNCFIQVIGFLLCIFYFFIMTSEPVLVIIFIFKQIKPLTAIKANQYKTSYPNALEQLTFCQLC